MDVHIGKFKTNDGLQLHYEHWSPPNPKGTIVFIHGMGDHCGRYGPFVDYFTKRGFRLFLYDQRGHGKSEGKRVFVKRFDQLLEDLEIFLDFSFDPRRAGFIPPSTLAFLVAHSFGGQVALNFLARHPQRFQSACAISPCLEVALTIPKWQERLGRTLRSVWPGMKLKNLTNPDFLSHDSAVIQNYKKDPLVSTYVTIGIGKELMGNLQTIYGLCNKIRTPLLMLHALEDYYCSVEGTKRFFKELRLEKKRLKLYEGMYHELLNEVQKEEVFCEIENWFDSVGVDLRPSP